MRPGYYLIWLNRCYYSQRKDFWFCSAKIVLFCFFIWPFLAPVRDGFYTHLNGMPKHWLPLTVTAHLFSSTILQCNFSSNYTTRHFIHNMIGYGNVVYAYIRACVCVCSCVFMCIETKGVGLIWTGRVDFNSG